MTDRVWVVENVGHTECIFADQASAVQYARDNRGCRVYEWQIGKPDVYDAVLVGTPKSDAWEPEEEVVDGTAY